MGFFDALSRGLERSREALNEVFYFGGEVDEDFWEDLEDTLVMGDMGAEIAIQVSDDLRDAAAKKNLKTAPQLRRALAEQLEQHFVPIERDPFSDTPSCVLFVGINGAGKTTTVGKIASAMAARGKNVVIGSADTFRAAAIEQLDVWGQRAGVPVIKRDRGSDPASVCYDVLDEADKRDSDLVLIDTAGRLHIDVALMDELKDLKELTHPNEIMLVVDAMTGQDAVNVAKAFDDALGIDSVLMSKLDSDTRGGAALSVLAVTGKPIKYVGMGEKLDEFEQFHPQRMASRILGMGDMLTLIEKAESTISQKDAEKMAKKFEENRFDMNDLLEQLRQIQKMGSLKSIIGMLPGVGSKLKDADIDDRQFVRIEAMITSMTKAERAKPSIINPSRKRRIAAGSGTKVEDVNRLLKQFDQMQKMMKQFGGKAGKGGKMNRRAMKRLANMNPEQLQSLQGGIPGVPPGLMPPKK